MKQEDDEQIPEYEEIFREDSDSEEEESEDEFGEKRKRLVTLTHS